MVIWHIYKKQIYAASQYDKQSHGEIYAMNCVPLLLHFMCCVRQNF